MEIDSIAEEYVDDGYENIAAKSSKTVEAKRNTVLIYFQSFLRELHEKDAVRHPFMRLSDAVLPKNRAYISKELCGKFIDYVTKQKSRVTKQPLKYNTVASYLSIFWEYLRVKYNIEVLDAYFVKKTRTEVRNKYVAAAKSTGVPIADQAPPLKVDELRVFSEILFKQNKVKSFEYRLALVLQWQCVGRVGEAAGMKASSFSFVKERDLISMMTEFVRTKAASHCNLRMIIARDCLYSCPMHALASFVAVSKTGPKLFTFITESNICNELNSQLQNLTEIASNSPYNMYVTPNLTSHSIRAGAATAACEHPAIKEYVVNRRGDWARGQDTSIIYKRMTLHSDGAIGRVLSFWPHIDIGGCPPERTDEIIPIDQVEEFQYLTYSLLGTAGLEPNLAECLCCVLLMHYEEVLVTLPGSILIERIDLVGIPRERLLQWGRALKTQFQIRNSLTISMEQLQHNTFLQNFDAMARHAGFMEQRVVSLQEEQFYSRTLLDEVNARTRAMQESQQRQEAMLQRMWSHMMAMPMQQTTYITESAAATASITNDTNPLPHYYPIFMPPGNQNPIAPTTVHGQQVVRRLPSDLSGPDATLGSMRCGTLFRRWFTESLFECEPRNGEEAALMRKMARVIAVMKSLLPVGTVINSKPATVAGFQDWTTKIDNLAENSDERLKICCEEERKIARQKSNKVVKRNKSIETFFYTTVKRFPRMKPQWFNLGSCVDQCTNAEYQQFRDINQVLGIK